LGKKSKINWRVPIITHLKLTLMRIITKMFVNLDVGTTKHHMLLLPMQKKQIQLAAIPKITINLH
jgi:hypothetical protein